MNQLYELLTEYGPIHEVWFDGAHPKRKGGQKYNYSAWKELIHKLAPKAVIFKTYKQDIARNLNAGFKIHYTTDGRTPTAESKEYTQPFALESGMVKAVALLNDEKGEVCQQQLGYLKEEWTIKAENPTTVTLQTDRPYSISGLMYTPLINDAMPMSVKGSVKLSENGTEWTDAETFEFGNLKNDPTCRYHYFKKPVKARFIRIEANEKIAKGAIGYDLF